MRSSEQTPLTEDAYPIVRRPLLTSKMQAVLCIVASIILTLTIIGLTWMLV